MRHVLVFAGVGLWIAVLSGCGGGDSSSAPEVADSATPGMTPGMTPGGPSGGASPTPGGSDPAMQGSASTNSTMPGAPSPSPAGSSSDMSVDSSAYQQQMNSGAPGPAPSGSDPSSAMPGYGPSGMTPDGSSQPQSVYPGGTPPPGYGPSGMIPNSSSEPPAVYQEGTMPPGYPPQGYTPPGYPPPGASPDSSYSPSGEPGAVYGSGYPGSGGMPGQQAQKPLTLAEKAVLAFRQGRDQDAIAYLYAQGITAEADEAKGVLDKMGWSVALKRPAMTVRWGIALKYVPLRNYNGSIFPIGTTQNVQVRGAAAQIPGGQPMGGMGDMPGGQAGMGGGVRSHPTLQQLTGELGTKVIAQLQERITRGDFGQAMTMLGKAAVPGSGGAGSGMGMSGYGEPGGMGMGADMGYGGSAPGGLGGPGQPQGASAVDAVPLAPGIVFLGMVTTKDMREKAQKAGVDVICLFDIVPTAIPKQQLLKNETTIQVYDLKQTKELFESKTLNNIQVQVERIERKSEQDPVDRELESLFKFVDANWQLGALPAEWKAEDVSDRLRGLLAETHENPLPVLAEARMYQTRGLLQAAHYLAACRKLLGEPDGSQLVNGSAEEKLEIVAKWLPEAS